MLSENVNKRLDGIAQLETHHVRRATVDSSHHQKDRSKMAGVEILTIIGFRPWH
jgi:hypothetical protein